MNISEQIKERIDVVELISGFVKLNKAGANFKGLCPFHKEKTPSFLVSQEKQIWHCFGCGEGGDIFKFIMKYENLEFSEALKVLAKQAGIELKKQDPRVQTEIASLYEVCQATSEFFSKNLEGSPQAKEYLKERGLSEKTINEWQIGFIPNLFDSLFLHLKEKGFAPDIMMKAGLVFQSSKDRSKYFDKFRGRIIFPISDSADRVVGFTGRIFGREENDKEPKYLNSPETIIFNKRRILYGFSKNKKDIREKDSVILVEGQMDLLATWQRGLKNVVASSGTSLTNEQLGILKRMTKNLMISFDMDEAGKMATERAIDLAKNDGFEVKIISLPDGNKDLADYLLLNKGEVSDLIDNKKEAGEYYYELAFKDLEIDDLDSKKKAIDFFLNKLEVFSPIEKSHWLKKVSNNLDIKIDYLNEEMKRVSDLGVNFRKYENNSERPSQIEKKMEEKIFGISRKELLIELLLSLMMRDEELRENFNSFKEYLSDEQLNLADVIIKKGGNFSADDVSSADEEKMGYLYLLSEYEFDGEEVDFKSEFDKAILELRKEFLRERIDDKRREIEQAEISQDKELLSKKLDEFNILLRQLSDG